MTPADLADLLHTTVATVLVEHGANPAVLSGGVEVERPRRPEHGDYATNVAMRMAEQAGMAPRDLAGLLAEVLTATDGIESAEVAGPGFLNIRLTVSARGAIVRRIMAAGAAYGCSGALCGTTINLEFASAELTDPVPLGGARRAVVGDALGRILAARGANVTREYFFDDLPETVKRLEDGVTVCMGKRAGTVVTLDGLVEVIGVDAARYVLVRSSMNAGIDIDLDLWAKASGDNPVYYVQHAHARACSIVDNAEAFEFHTVEPDFGLLTADREGELIRALGEYPRVVAVAAERREPHRVVRFLEELADVYHLFRSEDTLRVLPKGDEPVMPVNAARMALVQGTRHVLANGLGLLGVSAPERM